MSIDTTPRYDFDVVTRDQAQTILHWGAKGYQYAYGTPDGDDEPLRELARQLGWYLSATVDGNILEWLIVAFENLEQIEHGTHESLSVSRDGCDDNTAELTDYWQGEVNRFTRIILDHAGYRTSRELAHPIEF